MLQQPDASSPDATIIPDATADPDIYIMDQTTGSLVQQSSGYQHMIENNKYITIKL
jgi:hypothetical protein